MKKEFNKYTRYLTGVLFFSLFFSNAHGLVFLKNDSIIDSRAVKQIEIMGQELKEKTGVNTYIAAIRSLKGVPIVTYEQNLTKQLKSPYMLLVLARDDTQVDIVSSDDLKNKFDRDGVLSPYPWNGTILPILASKKGEDKYSAAILNGYGDVVDQIADSYDVKLDSSIGNANKIVIGILKVIFYSFLFLSIGILIYRKRKRVGRR